jgi:preprotein translocase subunit SecE
MKVRQANMAFNPGKFLREVRTESAKIVWPTRKETVMTGVMVVIMTSLLAIFFFGVDAFFSTLVKWLLGLLAR